MVGDAPWWFNEALLEPQPTSTSTSAEVFQLFLQDGLQERGSAMSEGTLGAHIGQEEATGSASGGGVNRGEGSNRCLKA